MSQGDMPRMVRFRVYTEDVKGRNLDQVVGRYFTGFSRIAARGVWKGRRERSVIFEIISENLPASFDRVEAVSKEIKKLANQEAVYLTCEPVQGVLV